MGEAELAEIELADRLRVAGAPLLAGLVQWHRREGRPRWWDIFRLKDLDLDQLERDRSVIGGLSAPEAAGTDKRSTLWRYTFAPQDTKVAARKGVLDVDTAAGVGSVFDIEPVEGWIVLKVGPDKPAPRPRGLSATLAISSGVSTVATSRPATVEPFMNSTQRVSATVCPTTLGGASVVSRT